MRKPSTFAAAPDSPDRPERIRAVDYLSDILGVTALFFLLIGGCWLAHGAGLPTGGDQLLQVAK